MKKIKYAICPVCKKKFVKREFYDKANNKCKGSICGDQFIKIFNKK